MEPFEKHNPTIGKELIEESVRSQFFSGKIGALVDVIAGFIQKLHDHNYGLRDGVALKNANIDKLREYGTIYSVPDYGLGTHWYRTFITYKIKTKFYNAKLYGSTGLIELCKYVTGAAIVEHVQVGARGHTVYCYVNYEITDKHLVAFNDLLVDLKLINRSICVFLVPEKDFARDINREPGTVPMGSFEEGTACYQILA
jgi:hypothetical protein